MLSRFFSRSKQKAAANRAGEAIAKADACMKAGDLSAAETLLRAAEGDAPDDPDILAGLGSCLGAAGRFDAAAETFRRALAASPRQPVALMGLGNIALTGNRFDEAIGWYRAYLEAVPGDLAVTRNLLTCFHHAGRWGEAVPYAQAWLQAAPGDPEAQFQKASLEHCLNEGAALAASLRELLRLKPTHMEGLYLRACQEIQAGEFAAGWKDYEVRIPLKMGVRIPPYSRWLGNPLPSGTLLVTLEQGVGDAFMFARFLPEIQARAANVLLVCTPAVADLFRCSFPDLRVAEVGSDVANVAQPILWLPLLSAPFVLQHFTLADYASPRPYLAAPEERIRHFAALIPGSPRKRIGLVWLGNRDRVDYLVRALPDDVLARIVDSVDADWYSLQVGGALPAAMGGRVTDLAPHFKTFADTAAAIACLDAVVAIDTSVAHLAGAMGKPTFVLEPNSDDWRWRMAGAASPWYPTVQLFKAAPDPAARWDGAVAALAAALERFAATA